MDSREKAIEFLNGPMNYLMNNEGKRLRDFLCKAINNWHKCSSEIEENIKDIVGELHNASLLIDDIQDGSHLRRGKPCGYLVFGVPATTNSVNYFFFNILNKVKKLDKLKRLDKFHSKEDYEMDLTEIYGIMMKDAHIGQAMDMYFRDNSIIPSENEYLKMVHLKIGLFFIFIWKMFQFFSEIKFDLEKLFALVGRYFQIENDYVNLMDDEYMKGKGFAEDISEGKFSFPIIHGLKNSPESDLILQILKQKTENQSLKQLLIDTLIKAGSFEYTRSVLEDLKNEISEELKKFPENLVFNKLLDEIIFLHD